MDCVPRDIEKLLTPERITLTFCMGIKVEDGLIALADSEIVKGGERLSKGKLSLLTHGEGFVWIMTSGLRSVRDKTMTYTENAVAKSPGKFQRMFEVANLFGEQLRLVREEDGPSLLSASLSFNLHAIIGGRLQDDAGPTMYYVYPEGNWIEVSADSPYFIIGRTHYAKPIVDRLLTSHTDLRHAAALAYLGFDATRTSVTDVDFPIDMVAYDAKSKQAYQHRYQYGELEHAATWWQQHLRTALHEFPLQWIGPLLGKSNELKQSE